MVCQEPWASLSQAALSKEPKDGNAALQNLEKNGLSAGKSTKSVQQGSGSDASGVGTVLISQFIVHGMDVALSRFRRSLLLLPSIFTKY